MIDFCNDVAVWMEKNPDNVIVVHCKGGKGQLILYNYSTLHFVRCSLYLSCPHVCMYNVCMFHACMCHVRMFYYIYCGDQPICM